MHNNDQDAINPPRPTYEELARQVRMLEQKADQAYKILDNLPTLICEFQPDSTLSYVNKAYADYFNQPKKALIGRKWLDLLPAEEQDSAQSHYQSLTRENPVHSYQHRMTTADGGFRWQKWTHVAVFDKNGIFIEYQAIGEDTTCHKQTKEQLRAISQAGADPMVVYDMQGRPLFINRAFSEVFGWTLAEVEGRRIPYIPEGEQNLTSAEIKRLLNTGDPARFESKRLTKDGRLLNILISASMIKDADGRPTGMVVNLTDITERKTLEAQFRQTQKLEAIGTLAGGIAHDFNNILSAIMGYTELSLDMVRDNSALLGNLKKIQIAGSRARDLIRQILTFSRQADQDLRPLQPKPVIKEALKLIRASLPSSIEINQKLIADVHIMADVTHLHQVVMNLCTNASHALNTRTGRIDVVLEDIEIDALEAQSMPNLPPGRYLKLSVADNGIGITPEIQERIFDPFFTTKPKGKGTGMGLSLVHGIIKRYAGQIMVQSQVNKGTTFSIYLPVIEDFSKEEIEDSSEPIPMGQERILLVDDEAHLVEIGRTMLEHLGYRVTATSSSVDALRIFYEAPGQFDLVITDLIMPNLTGDRLAEKILEVRPDIPLVAFTGFGENSHSEGSHLIMFKKIIVKPVSMREMGKVVRKVLDHQKPKNIEC